MVIEEVEVSPPQPMEIRVKVVATALCRSDFNAWLSQAILLFYHLLVLSFIYVFVMSFLNVNETCALKFVNSCESSAGNPSSISSDIRA